MYFRNYRLGKRGLDKCLKNPPSECPSINNMVNGHKHCCSLDDVTFTIFIDESEHNSVQESLDSCYVKS